MTEAGGEPVAFLGLGVMGSPMAGWLVKKGHKVTAWNRSPEKRAAWATQHPAARTADTPADAVAGARFVLMCLGDDPDVRGVFNQIKPHCASGTVLVDHTTGSADLAQQLGKESASAGFEFLDAPVSGGQAGAENGQLTVMVGGAMEAYESASPVISSFAKACVRIGPIGAGQLAKMANQIAIAGAIQGLAEAMHFIEANELDPATVIGAISKGAAQSWQMENRWKSMAEGRYDFGFAVDWMRKDLRITLDQARRSGAQLPVTGLVDQFYADVQAKGGGRLDTSSLRLRFPTSGSN
jgi:3-hydroxyisobutyrate dehydrogenase-like beta-hydroxyacid dehydrogenase